MTQGMALDRVVQPIRNITRNPYPTSTAWGNSVGPTSPTRTHSFQAGVGPAGRGAFRVAVDAGWSGANPTGPYSGTGFSGGQTYIPANTPVIASAWFRSSFAVTIKPATEMYSASNSYLGAASPVATTLTPNVWQRLSWAIPVQAVAYRTVFTGYSNGTNTWALGDWIEMTNCMLTPGSTLYDYSDGGTPGWKWMGTANAAESVGFPYTLTRALGGATKPLLSLGSTPASGTTTYPFTLPNADGSFTVYSIQRDPAYNSADGFWQTNNASQRTARLMAVGATAVETRPASNGSFLSGMTVYPTSITTSHIYGARIDMASARVSLNLDAGAVGQGNLLSPITDPVSDRIYVGSRDAAVQSQIATDALYLFAGAHTDTQMIAISRWIGNKYGLPTS